MPDRGGPQAPDLPIYQQVPIRLQASLISSPPVTPIDINTGLAPQFFRSNALEIDVAIFDAYGNSVNLSNLSFLQLILQAGQNALTPTTVVNVASGSLNPTVTMAQWISGESQQAAFLLSGAQTDVSLFGETSYPYWVIVQGILPSGAVIIYAAGTANAVLAGGGVAWPASGFTSFHLTPSASGNFTVSPTGQVHHEEVTVSGTAGTRNVILNPYGLEAGALIGLRFELPTTSGIVFQIYDQSLTGTLLDTVITDASGFTPTARFQYYWNGSNFKRDFSVIPASGQQT